MTNTENILKVWEGFEKKQKELGRLSSAWGRGVHAYAFELFESLFIEGKKDLNDIKGVKNLFLLMMSSESNNARLLAENWSNGGCSLIYDEDIAERLCTPSELNRKISKRDGRLLNPNNRESWMDTQARALYQAEKRLREFLKQYAE